MTVLLFVLGALLMGSGVAFLLLAALGLLRLPDLLSRLHTLTKADTAGLALVALGAACLAGSLADIVPLVLSVVLVAVSGATVGHLIARAAVAPEDTP